MKNRSFRNELKRYNDKVKKWRSEIISENKYDKEQNTTIKFVVPLFEILGWGRLYKDMEFEYAVHNKKGKSIGRADIALYIKDSNKPKEKPKILVEIKRIQGKLGKGSQLFKYLKAEGINYGIYTNGDEIRLLDKRCLYPSCAPHTLFMLKARQFKKYRGALRILSKESVKRKKLDKLANLYDSEYKKMGCSFSDNDKRLEFALNFLRDIKKA